MVTAARIGRREESVPPYAARIPVSVSSRDIARPEHAHRDRQELTWTTILLSRVGVYVPWPTWSRVTIQCPIHNGSIWPHDNAPDCRGLVLIARNKNPGGANS